MLWAIFAKWFRANYKYKTTATTKITNLKIYSGKVLPAKRKEQRRVVIYGSSTDKSNVGDRGKTHSWTPTIPHNPFMIQSDGTFVSYRGGHHRVFHSSTCRHVFYISNTRLYTASEQLIDIYSKFIYVDLSSATLGKIYIKP